MAALRRRLVIAEATIMFLLTRVVDLSALKDRMLDVLERQVMEHTELRMRLSCVTPLAALDALGSAPGWQTTAPTAAEVWAHGAAHPFRPEDAYAETIATDGNNGLWAIRCREHLDLVEMGLVHGEVIVWTAGALTLVRLADDLALRAEDVDGWLRLTADGRPVRHG